MCDRREIPAYSDSESDSECDEYVPKYDDFGNLLNPREEEEEEAEFTADYFRQKACTEVKGTYGAGYRSNKALNKEANRAVKQYECDAFKTVEEGPTSDGSDLIRSIGCVRSGIREQRTSKSKILTDQQIHAEMKAKAKAAEAAERASEAASRRAKLAAPSAA